MSGWSGSHGELKQGVTLNASTTTHATRVAHHGEDACVLVGWIPFSDWMYSTTVLHANEHTNKTNNNAVTLRRRAALRHFDGGVSCEFIWSDELPYHPAGEAFRTCQFRSDALPFDTGRQRVTSCGALCTRVTRYDLVILSG